MKFKHIALTTVAASTLFTGGIAVHQADASVIQQNGIILHDDSKMLEHEVSYIDYLVNPKTDQETKERIENYFAAQGLNSLSEIITKAKQDGFDVSKYESLI
ncbi:SPIN family peroxidase inhibitor [Macrococcoides canis]|uniref:SPIN family peroxidase inhibitor n=1 Tax=Macrococcoides canis TaxID=1855823 RepID=A0A1W7AF76_9STAP|nr:SPIN family peroxidase inhibitor [Macrococcus canis]ARQ08076.1 hypothetical protein MCCS_25200 [Macrococcus canis]